jgi:hypothetical protein
MVAVKAADPGFGGQTNGSRLRLAGWRTEGKVANLSWE